MKKNAIFLLILALIMSLTAVFSQSFPSDTPQLRGARYPDGIASLDSTFCENAAVVDIVPDTYNDSCEIMVWKVSVNQVYNPDQPAWYSVTGTGKSSVLHFNPAAVPAIYNDSFKILISYTQYDKLGPLESTYDYTYIYSIPTDHNFGNDTTLCLGESANLTLDGSDTNIRYVLLRDATPVDSLAGTGASLSFSQSTAGTYTVIARNISNTACSATMSGSAKIDFYPPNVPVITGSTNVCIDDVLGKTYTTAAGMTNYVWTIQGGGTIAAGAGTNEITVNWSPVVGSQSVSVSYDDTNLCAPATPTVYSVTIQPKPIPVLNGSVSVCVNSTVNYTTDAGMNGYVWTVSGGGTITSGAGTNSINVDWSVLGAQNVTVTYVDQFGCTPVTPTVLPVTVNDRPIPIILGIASLCEGTTGVTYQTQAGMSSYSWTIPSGGTITSGAGSNQIEVTWNTAGSQTVTVNFTNAAGCRALTPTVLPVAVNPRPLPSVLGEDLVCLGLDTNLIYMTEPGMSSYVWAVSAGGVINSGQGTDQIDVTWSALGGKTVTVSYVNIFGCSPVVPTAYNIEVFPLPSPTIIGTDTLCTGVSGVVYTSQSGKTNYDWQISGGTITSGAGTNQVEVTWNIAGDNWISINYEETTGCSSATPFVYNVFAKPINIPSIIGPSSFCLDTTSIKTYTTDPGYLNYDWIVSAGGVVQSGLGTNQITVKWYTSGAKTVSVNYENTFGCFAPTPTVKNVTVNPIPKPTIIGTATVCVGASGITYTTEAGMSAYNWTISGGTITSGFGTNQITVTWNTVGAKYVRVNYTNVSGCTASTATQFNVTVSLSPSPTINGTDTVCVGSTNVTYTTQAFFSNYNWIVSPGGTITGGLGTRQITVTWNTSGSQTVSVNYENVFGCTAVSPAVFKVEVLPKPVPTITGPISTCKGNAVYTTEVGMSGYVWNVSAGGTITSGVGTNAITVNWTLDGARTVSVSYTSVGGCPAAMPTVKNVTVNPSAVPTIIGNNTVCGDGTDVTYTTEAGMSIYTWGVSAGGVITSGAGTNQITVAWSGSGAKIITVNYLNAFGCPAQTPKLYGVTVNPLPSPSVIGAPVVCLGDAGITYTTEAGMSNYTWNVSAGGTITSGVGTNQIEVTWSTLGPQTVSVNYSNGNNCTAASPVVHNVSVVTMPVPTITESNGACIGSITTYTTEPFMMNYLWNVSPDGLITSGAGTNEITVLWGNTGAQTVDVTYQTPTGCAPLVPTVENFTVIALPSPSITGSSVVCQGSTGNVYSTEAGMSNYAWSVTGGTITSGAGTDAIELTFNADGVQTVSVNYEDANGCSALASTDSVVSVITAPVPVITGTDSVCKGSTGVAYSTDAGMSAYTWTVSAGGTITSGAGTNAIQVTWDTKGEQTVSVSYTGLNGCNALTPTIYNVFVKHVDASLSSNNGATICDGDATIFTATVSGGQGATNYDFYVSGSPVQSGAINTYSSSAIADNDKVYVTITDANGCQDTDTITMTVNPLPVVTLNITSAGGNTICDGDQVDFVSTSGMVNYTYYINASPINNGANPYYATTALNDGDQVYVTVESPQGCYNSSAPAIDMTVVAYPTAGLVANPGTSIIEGTNVDFTASGIGDYQFLINSTEVQPYSTTATYSSITLTDGDTVQVNVKNANGCVASSYLVLSVLETVVVKPVLVSPSAYCEGAATGATVFVNNPQSGVTYELIRIADTQNLGAGVVAGSVVSWTNVKNSLIGSQEYKVEAYYPAFPGDRMEMSNRVDITESPLPLVYNVIPTGTVTDCNGGTGYEIKLSDSELGVTYELYKNGSPTGNIVAGTGAEISFGFIIPNGIYTVKAETDAGDCVLDMNGSYTINYASTQIIYNLTSNPFNGRYCEGDAGVEILLNGSTLGESYILYRNVVDSITTVIGTGASISFGTYTTEGTYTAVVYDGCYESMAGSVVVIKDLKPIAYVVSASNNGKFCEGGSGVSISLSNQQVGVSYQLLLNGSPIGFPVVGTLAGAVLDFPGLYTNVGTYSVQQSNLSCVTTTTNNATVTEIALPNNTTVSGDTLFCASGSASIYVDNSEAGVTYTLYRDGLTTGVSSLGNGGQLLFLVNQVGTYKFTAVRTVAPVSCPIWLADSINVSEVTYPLVKNYSWVSGSGCSNGTVITVENSELGVLYTIYNRGTSLPVSGYSLIGNGSDISFPGIVDSNGDYYIVASKNGVCSVEFTNFGDIHIAIIGVATKMEVVMTPSSVCVGDSVTIGLKDTESSDIRYDLYLNGVGVVQTMYGNGSAKNFPTKITTGGLYYVTGTDTTGIPPCDMSMLNPVTVIFNPNPVVYNVVGSGVYCDVLSGAVLGLDASELGYKYYLQYDNGPGFTLVDSIVSSGGTFNFPAVTDERDFSVYAVNPSGCTSNMNDTVSVVQKPNPKVYTVSKNDSTYCGTSLGGDIILSGTESGITYVVTDTVTKNVVATYLATTDKATPQIIATLPEGVYAVSATWGGSVCSTLLTSFITIQKAPVPTTPINITIDDILICEGDSSYVRVANVQTGVIYDLMKNNVLQAREIDSATDLVVWKVDGLAGANDDYRVFGYFPGYRDCGQTSSKVVNLQVKTKPTSFALSPSTVSTCYGNPGASFTVSGSEPQIVYELYNQSNTRVDNYLPSLAEVGNPFTFSKSFTDGVYTLVASYLTGRCSSSPNAVSTITKDDSSLVCFPFEAIADTLYLNNDQMSNSLFVSNPLNGGNDVISDLVDVNMAYTLITSWVNANGDFVNTKGLVIFDSVNKDYLTYEKAKGFFGKDSVLYEIKNLDRPNRIDTAVVYILVGNKELDDDRNILIPNAFTPNGDGKNDKLEILGYEDQLSSVLKIFNRWGSLVYESDGEKYLNDWEGMANKGMSISVGKELPVGTYFYVYSVSFKQEGNIVNKKYSGYIELRR